MFALLPAPALAETMLVRCDAWVFASSPAVNSGPVPVDANLSIAVSSDCLPRSWTVEAVDAGGVVLDSAAGLTAAEGARLITLDPAVDLPPDADLVLRATGELGAVVEIPFHTGTERGAPMTGDPEIAVFDAGWERGRQTARFMLALTPADDPDGLSLVRVDTPETATFLPAIAGDQAVMWRTAERLEPGCVTATQIDALGNEAATEACFDEVTVSCATAGAPTAGLVVAALALLRRRR